MGILGGRPLVSSRGGIEKLPGLFEGAQTEHGNAPVSAFEGSETATGNRYRPCLPVAPARGLVGSRYRSAFAPLSTPDKTPAYAHLAHVTGLEKERGTRC